VSTGGDRTFVLSSPGTIGYQGRRMIRSDATLA
jgi:hypothetical protein